MIYSNNQFVTEIGLIEDLPLHPCHTDDPKLADAFVVPVQVKKLVLTRTLASELFFMFRLFL